jgi:hypothetical protein
VKVAERIVPNVAKTSGFRNELRVLAVAAQRSLVLISKSALYE